ncbi:N-acetylmuramoyl-L-alanine amidase [Ornithinibacillus halotolerans]|uniref:N-acetylmuramoyl-L-alanine amidase n=1 Tax=Ornithinibacillus halotolerans TaxID=1274357 RepID=A0A916RT58_9BACI|nr:N-acetylmuramoyl-L-alanine amidase [Ornithinibacillus halotolerans]GGA69186.1 N-acetylmuramoyl-L-alanine amidase [Ornithinibacillus halotolerans]
MRYKKGLVILCAILILGNFSVSAEANEVIINEDGVNLRGGPGTDHSVLGQVYKDEKYPFVSRDGEWIEIQFNGSSAWVIQDFVTILADETPGDTIEMDESDTISNPVESLHIRSGPSTKYEIIAFVSKGEELVIIGETDNWYKVKLDSSEGYIYKALVDESNETSYGDLNGKTIVVDPGHGGNDSGALSSTEVYERDIAYKTAKILAQELSMLGAEVILTRDEDTFVSLTSRATISNTVNASAFISLHYNSFPESPSVTGISTYYYNEQSESLAQYIQEETVKKSGDRDRGYDFGDFQVIRQNLMPSVLVELGFISNPEIDQLLATNAYQKKLVAGMVNGLQRYFNN